MKQPATRRETLWFFILLGSGLLLTALGGTEQRWRNAVLDLVTPVLEVPQRIAAGTLSTRSWWQSRAGYRTAIAALQEENLRLRTRLHEQELQVRDAAALRAALALRAGTAAHLLPALITGADITGQSGELYLNRGSDDGLVAYQPVLGLAGEQLVCLGRLSSIGARSARLRPLTAAGSRLPAQLAVSGYRRTILAGSGDARCRLLYVPAEITVLPGEEIRTAGDGELLPAGLLLGRVSSVSSTADPFREIIVTPAADAAVQHTVWFTLPEQSS